MVLSFEFRGLYQHCESILPVSNNSELVAVLYLNILTAQSLTQVNGYLCEKQQSSKVQTWFLITTTPPIYTKLKHSQHSRNLQFQWLRCMPSVILHHVVIEDGASQNPNGSILCRDILVFTEERHTGNLPREHVNPMELLGAKFNNFDATSMYFLGPNK